MLKPLAVTQGVTHVGVYHRPSDGHFSQGPFRCQRGKKVSEIMKNIIWKIHRGLLRAGSVGVIGEWKEV